MIEMRKELNLSGPDISSLQLLLDSILDSIKDSIQCSISDEWSDCHLAGALGLLRILVYKAHEDGVIFLSLLQLQRGITDVEDGKQKQICATKYRRRDEMDKGKLTEIEIEREEECGICMEMNTKVVLPGCNHSVFEVLQKLA